MFSKSKKSSQMDAEQRELYDNARKRTLQKKRLFQHFIIFLIGAAFLIVINVGIGYKEEFMPLGYNWFLWAILLWGFIFLVHFFNVFVINNFMGKEWEANQMERLVRRQKEKIARMQQDVERDYPEPSEKSPAPKKIDPEKPNKPYNT